MKNRRIRKGASVLQFVLQIPEWAFSFVISFLFNDELLFNMSPEMHEHDKYVIWKYSKNILIQFKLL